MYAAAQRSGKSGARTRAETERVDELVALHGMPLIILDPNVARRQYRELQAAFPFVRLHYDVSALAHPAVIAAVAECGGHFEIACEGALAVLQRSQVDPARAVHTHPVKHPQDVLAAYNAGVRTFVVDSQAEVEKFIGYPDDVRLILRLRFPSRPEGHVPAVVHGVGVEQAAGVIRFAQSLGVRIDGFSLLLTGGQTGAQPYAAAISRTLGLMIELEGAYDCRFDVLDLGNDFPATARGSAAELAEVARAVRTLLSPLAGRMTVIAETGTITRGSLTLITDRVQTIVDPVMASDSIEAGASVVVVDGRPDVTGSLFRIISDTRHRIFHHERRPLQTRAAAD